MNSKILMGCLFAASMLTTSCSLDEDPKGQMAQETYFTCQADLDASGGFVSSLTDIEGPAVDELEDEEEDIDLLNQGQYFDDASDDSVRLYLREIGKIPLLNGEEELELAQKVVANRDELAEAQEKLASDDTKSAERQKLESKIAKLSRPKDKMAEANMRLVVSIAKRYSGRGLDLLDLIQEGNTGLLRAGKIRPGQGIQIQYLRHLVDPPGDYSRDR
jgi:RNA polymerase primary sigma factor